MPTNKTRAVTKSAIKKTAPASGGRIIQRATTSKLRSNRSLSLMPSLFPEIGYRLKAVRKTMNATQADVASIIGCSLSTLKMVETGKQNANIHMIRMIKRWSGASYDYILDGVDLEG